MKKFFVGCLVMISTLNTADNSKTHTLMQMPEENVLQNQLKDFQYLTKVELDIVSPDTQVITKGNLVKKLAGEKILPIGIVMLVEDTFKKFRNNCSTNNKSELIKIAQKEKREILLTLLPNHPEVIAKLEQIRIIKKK